MKVVSVSELKARLSRFIRVVKRGGEVEITERGVPVARLIATSARPAGDDDHLERLAAAGIVRLGTGDFSWMASARPVRSGGSLLEALDEDREDRV